MIVLQHGLATLRQILIENPQLFSPSNRHQLDSHGDLPSESSGLVGCQTRKSIVSRGISKTTRYALDVLQTEVRVAEKRLVGLTIVTHILWILGGLSWLRLNC